MHAQQPVGGECPGPICIGLHGGAHVLQAHGHALPGCAHGIRLGGDQVEPGAARECLAHAQPRPHAARPCRGGAVADHLRIPGRRAEGDGVVPRHPRLDHRDAEGEEGNVCRDDHANICSHDVTTHIKPPRTPSGETGAIRCQARNHDRTVTITCLAPG